jgi:hypothetical protein
MLMVGVKNAENVHNDTKFEREDQFSVWCSVFGVWFCLVQPEALLLSCFSFVT